MYANPYNVCNKCKQRTTNMTSDARNLPCNHKGGFISVCPSWNPVTGCECKEVLDHVPHGTP